LAYIRKDYKGGVVTRSKWSELDTLIEDLSIVSRYNDNVERGMHGIQLSIRSEFTLAQGYEHLQRLRSGLYPKDAKAFASWGREVGISGSKAVSGGLLAPGWLAEGAEKRKKELVFLRPQSHSRELFRGGSVNEDLVPEKRASDDK
jgi:hypothetical protein